GNGRSFAMIVSSYCHDRVGQDRSASWPVRRHSVKCGCSGLFLLDIGQLALADEGKPLTAAEARKTAGETACCRPAGGRTRRTKHRTIRGSGPGAGGEAASRR